MLLKPHLFLAVTLLGIGFVTTGIYPDSAVTTSIGDAYPVAHWLDSFDRTAKPAAASTFSLTPGYYRATIQSYCLHAGAYGPTTGDGYLIAPLRGQKAGLIRSILQRSVEHPEVSQEDIQRLIWGIEAGASISDYPSDYLVRVSPVLPSEESDSITRALIASLKVGRRVAPERLGRALDFYGNLRQRVTDAQTTYRQLEQLAVKTGAAPEGRDSRRVDPGSWSYAGNDFYMRAFPTSYPTTTVEILLPACYRLQRDRHGRISQLESGEYKIEAYYDDLGSDRWTSRFSLLRFIGPEGSFVIRDAGWVVSSQAASYSYMRIRPVAVRSSPISTNRVSPSYPEQSFVSPGKPTDARLTDYQARINDATRKWNELDLYRRQWRRSGQPAGEAASDLTDLTHFLAGLEGLKGVVESQGKQGLFRAQLERVRGEWIFANCLVSGDCSAGGWDRGCSRVFDPSGDVATPGNTSQQRLGMSARIKNPQPRIP